MKTLLLIFCLSSLAYGQWSWAVDPTPTLAPHSCPCVDCKCINCECDKIVKPVESVKKITTPSEASVIVRATKGKEAFQASGTAIDEHTVVTCWHVLREGWPVTVNGMPAKVLKVDSKSDVALLAVDGSLKHVPVASEPLKAGEACTAYGYEYSRNGILYRWRTKVTGVNRYRGFPNVSILGKPLSGRSGGGLFNAAGELVGVCSAADGQEGLYCGLDAIKKLLNPDNNSDIVSRNQNMGQAHVMNCPSGQCFPPIAPQAIKPKANTPLRNAIPDFLKADPNCPDGRCPLIPKQAPRVSNPAQVKPTAGVSPGRAAACPTCPSARQNSFAVPSFPSSSRTRGIFWRGRR
jgi:hypothetical protein